MAPKIPENARKRIQALDVLTTLPELLTHHLNVRPDAVAFKSYRNSEKRWKDYTFRETAQLVERWRHALAGLGLPRGARCAMLLPNCIEAVLFDQAVLANACVPVPLHAIDTPKSSAYILQDSGA